MTPPLAFARWLVLLSCLLLFPGLALAQPEPQPEPQPPAQTAASKQTTEADRFAWLPRLSVTLRAGMGAHRSSACPCIDRSQWSVDTGLNLAFSRWVSFDAEYRQGAILLGGNFPFSGYTLGARSALLPESDRWWDEFYARAGVGWVSIYGTRDDSYFGLYAHPGWSVNLIHNLYMEHEVALSYYFGPMAHLHMGWRSGLRFEF